MMYREILEQSYAVACSHQSGLSRLVYLSESIFDYTTYDSDVAELFARKTIEVCAAINEQTTFAYIADEDNYRWFLLVVNMPPDPSGNSVVGRQGL
jgi:hypothetical protein